MDPQIQQTVTPPPTSPIPPTMPTEHKKVGPIVAILTIVLILVIGAIYLFASRINKEEPAMYDNNMPANTMNSDTSTDPNTVKPGSTNSDDVDSLNADLNASSQGMNGQSF